MPTTESILDLFLTANSRPDLLASEQKAPPVVHELGVILHSAAYSGFQAPLNAITQPFGGKPDTIISAPEQTKAWSKDWHFQQIGSGIGMLAPILASRKLLTSVFPSVTANLAAEKGLEALTKQEAKFLARYELGISVGTGLIYGAALTPSKLEPGQSLLDARVRQSAGAGLTFGTLTLASSGIKSIASSAALKETTIGNILRKETVSTGLAGIPAAIVSVDAHQVLNGKGLPTFKQHFDSKYGEALYNFSIVGAGIGYFTGPSMSRTKDKTASAMERAATDNVGSRSSKDLLLDLTARLEGPSKIADLPVDSVPVPNLKFARDVRHLPRLKEGVEISEMGLARFEREALVRTAEPVRVYEAEGVPFKVVAPETYAAKLDLYAALKKQAELPGAEGARARLELERPEMAELADRMTVADAFRQGLMTPEPGQFREIHLLDTANPYDAWYQMRNGNKSFKSAADTVFQARQTNWYRKDRGPVAVEDMMHEWGHLFDEYHPLDAQVIRIAARIDGLVSRPYANVPREQVPILVGEFALSQSGTRAAELMRSSPVTANAIAEGLLNVLAKVPEGKKSPLHEHLVSRATQMRNETAPIARQSLLEIIKSDPTTPEANDALRALVFLGQPKDFQGLVDVRTVDLSYEPLTDARAAKIGQIPRITEVDLSSTFAGPETVRALEGKPLEAANLSGTNVSNASIGFLPATLRVLNLSGAKLIGDAAVPFLARLKGLEQLDVTNTNLSLTALGALKRELPNTEISHD